MADGVVKKEQEKRVLGKETEKRGERERAAENMRLKCNVLERRRREREKPGHVMQLGGTAHWQNVEGGSGAEEKKAPDTLSVSPCL